MSTLLGLLPTFVLIGVNLLILTGLLGPMLPAGEGALAHGGSILLIAGGMFLLALGPMAFGCRWVRGRLKMRMETKPLRFLSVFLLLWNGSVLGALLLISPRPVVEHLDLDRAWLVGVSAGELVGVSAGENEPMVVAKNPQSGQSRRATGPRRTGHRSPPSGSISKSLRAGDLIGMCVLLGVLAMAVLAKVALFILAILIWFSLIIYGLVLPIWAIIDCATQRSDDGTKVAWMLVCLILWTLGSILYAAFGSKSTALKIVGRLGFLIAVVLPLGFTMSCFSMATIAGIVS